MLRKIEVNEDDLKKIILILKLSKKHVNIHNEDLILFNLWRVSGKLADKLMKKAQLTMVENRGRTTLKRVEDIPFDEPAEDKPSEEPNVEDSSEEPSPKRVPRFRKRKFK